MICRKCASEFQPWYVVAARESCFAWRSFSEYLLRQLENNNYEVK